LVLDKILRCVIDISKKKNKSKRIFLTFYYYYIGQSKRICNVRMKDHENDEKSHVFEHHDLTDHRLDFENVEILDRADTIKKLELKEILHIRQLKPTLNKQLESELFTLIIRNVKLETKLQ
jgi:hypothetical protein